MLRQKGRHCAGVLLTLAAYVPGLVAQEDPADTAAGLETFVARLEELADQLHMPGLSAAVIADQTVIWSGGFGSADVENQIPADADTPYRIASLSKPIAAVVLLQLVEEGALDLDSPMADFEIRPWFEPDQGSWAHYPERYADGDISVRHVLNHTSESEPPGEEYSYSGNIFADLTWVIEDITRRPYPLVLHKRVFEPLGMTRSAAGQLVPWREDAAREIATPYQVVNGERTTSAYPGFGLDQEVDAITWRLDPAYRLPAATQDARRRLLGEHFTPLHSSQTAAGAMTTVNDLTKFDIALDRGDLISAESREQMFTTAQTGDGDALPYGLGWFVEEWQGTKLVWHYGWFPPSISALYVKVPDHGLTLLLLANSDGLSSGVSWTAEGVRASPFARLFLDHFVTDHLDSD